MYKAARQEAFRALTQVIATNPQTMLPVVGDIWAKNADFPDADVLSSRFKKLLPPNLQEAEGEDAQSQLVAAKAQLQTLSAQYNQAVAELTRASDTIRTKRLEIESRERIAAMNDQTQLVLQQLKSHDAGAQALLDAQLEALHKRLDFLHSQLGIEEEAGQPLNTPELPDQVEPRVQPVTPAAPVTRPQPINPGGVQ